MNKIGPNDRLYPADRRVQCRQQGNEQNSPEIDPDIDVDAREKVLPNDLNNNPSEIKADADAKNARKNKNTACDILRPRAETDFQELIDALYAVSIVRPNKRERDEDPSQDRTDS